MKRNYYVYDLESYPNIFLFGGKITGQSQLYIFELSDRVNHLQSLIAHLQWVRNSGLEMVGFNNLEYDYPIVHELMTNPYTFSYEKAYQLTQQIITAQRRNNNLQRIKFSERYIPQIDLVKVNHFDNDAKRTSLKALQFAMRSESLEDLPFRPGHILNDQEKDHLVSYNGHDLTETEKFLEICEPAIEMRREYLEDGVLFGDVLNYSDVKIGVEYLISRIGRNKCYQGGKPKQTFRQVIEFNRIILSKISFRTELFNNVLSWFKQQVYYVGGDKPSLTTNLAGLEFHYGVGGVHASASNKIFHSDDEYQIIDLDVAGMYVAVAIANGFAPEHLGELFSIAYKQIKEDRARYPKGSSRNAALKLAGNGAYGNSNNPYSPLYDPQYTFTVTVNGQLQLTQLVEMIDLLPDTELIQANTDGITIRICKKYEPWLKLWISEWEKMTGLMLERVEYKRMWIRDVNNYIAETMEGKLKRKGAYWYPTTLKEYEGWWNKDFSNHASKIAAEKYMTHGWSLETGVKLVTNPFDFMLRYKATGESKLFIGDEEQLKTVRYYVSRTGKPMKKVAPPKGEIGQYKRKNGIKDSVYESVLKEIGPGVWDERIHTKNKSKYGITETSIQSGWLVKECNRAEKFDRNDVDWKYYIEEAKKLIIGE